MPITFSFIGPINDENILALLQFVDSHPEATNLLIKISSLGGSVSSGITIYNYLKSLPIPVHTHNLGDVASSAILVYLAGNTRTAEDVSKFLIHPLTIGVSGDLPYYSVQELLHKIDGDIQNFHTVICTETNSLNGLYDIDKYLRNNSLVLNKHSAYEAGIVTAL